MGQTLPDNGPKKTDKSLEEKEENCEGNEEETKQEEMEDENMDENAIVNAKDEAAGNNAAKKDRKRKDGGKNSAKKIGGASNENITSTGAEDEGNQQVGANKENPRSEDTKDYLAYTKKYSKFLPTKKNGQHSNTQSACGGNTKSKGHLTPNVEFLLPGEPPRHRLLNGSPHKHTDNARSSRSFEPASDFAAAFNGIYAPCASGSLFAPNGSRKLKYGTSVPDSQGLESQHSKPLDFSLRPQHAQGRASEKVAEEDPRRLHPPGAPSSMDFTMPSLNRAAPLPFHSDFPTTTAHGGPSPKKRLALHQRPQFGISAMNLPPAQTSATESRSAYGTNRRTPPEVMNSPEFYKSLHQNQTNAENSAGSTSRLAALLSGMQSARPGMPVLRFPMPQTLPPFASPPVTAGPSSALPSSDAANFHNLFALSRLPYPDPILHQLMQRLNSEFDSGNGPVRPRNNGASHTATREGEVPYDAPSSSRSTNANRGHTRECTGLHNGQAAVCSGATSEGSPASSRSGGTSTAAPSASGGSEAQDPDAHTMKYYEKRRKNNEAAKKSRNTRKLKEGQQRQLFDFLSREMAALLLLEAALVKFIEMAKAALSKNEEEGKKD